MTQQEIQERNKQIALMLRYALPSIQFNESWHNLMEAVELIRTKGWSYDMYSPSDHENKEGIFECNFWDKVNHEIEGRSTNELKEAVFIAVSQFAKLYNEKKL
jgi:hypothetical protein